MGRSIGYTLGIMVPFVILMVVGWNLPANRETTTETITSATVTTVDTEVLTTSILEVAIKPCPDAADFQELSGLLAQAYLVAEADPKPLQFGAVAAQTQVSQWMVCHSQVAEGPAVPKRVRK